MLQVNASPTTSGHARSGKPASRHDDRGWLKLIDTLLKDRTDNLPYAAGAFLHIPEYHCRGLVVAGDSNKFGAGAN
jgi:hypothetical protein